MINTQEIAQQLASAISVLVPEFLSDAIDFGISKGNAALMIVDSSGTVTGRIYGTDKKRGRESSGIAHRKVMQVWLTGYATGRFEELVFSKQLDDSVFGLSRPDFIGWMGGIPLLLDDGSMLAVAFSGFRGEKDVEIIKMAASKIKGLHFKPD